MVCMAAMRCTRDLPRTFQNPSQPGRFASGDKQIFVCDLIESVRCRLKTKGMDLAFAQTKELSCGQGGNLQNSVAQILDLCHRIGFSKTIRQLNKTGCSMSRRPKI